MYIRLETDELSAIANVSSNAMQSMGQTKTLTEIAAISQAMSFKRMADVLEHFKARLDAEEAKDAARKNHGTSYDDFPGGQGEDNL